MDPLIRIVCTRKIDVEKKKLAMNKGILIDDMDFISIRYIHDGALATTLKKMDLPFVFTSQHAVKALSQVIENDISRLKNTSCFCLNGATSRSALELGFNIIAQSQDARSLARKIITRKIKELIFLSA